MIEEAWRRGARFDSWTEQFRGDAWTEALGGGRHVGRGAGHERRSRADAPLPWDVIAGVVDRELPLERVGDEPLRGETTPDCRWEGCSDCGACATPPANDLAATFRAGRWSRRSRHRIAGDAGCGTPAARSGGRRTAATGAYVLTFSVTGRGRFVGHLDRVGDLPAGGAQGRGAAWPSRRACGPSRSSAWPFRWPWEWRACRSSASSNWRRSRRRSSSSGWPRRCPSTCGCSRLQPYDGPRSLAARVVGASYEVRGERAAPGDGCDRSAR